MNIEYINAHRVLRTLRCYLRLAVIIYSVPSDFTICLTNEEIYSPEFQTTVDRDQTDSDSCGGWTQYGKSDERGMFGKG